MSALISHAFAVLSLQQQDDKDAKAEAEALQRTVDRSKLRQLSFDDYIALKKKLTRIGYVMALPSYLGGVALSSSVCIGYMPNLFPATPEEVELVMYVGLIFVWPWEEKNEGQLFSCNASLKPRLNGSSLCCGIVSLCLHVSRQCTITGLDVYERTRVVLTITHTVPPLRRSRPAQYTVQSLSLPWPDLVLSISSYVCLSSSRVRLHLTVCSSICFSKGAWSRWWWLRALAPSAVSFLHCWARRSLARCGA